VVVPQISSVGNNTSLTGFILDLEKTSGEIFEIGQKL
jgi:hypothetical protein